MFSLVVAAAGGGAIVACNDISDPPPLDGVELVPLIEGLSFPVFLTAPEGDARLFIVEKAGRIRVVVNGTLAATPFLNISGLVSTGSEQGLLGLAFHPDYETNGHFYVNYTDVAGNTRIVRYTVSGDANVADAGSAKPILTVNQPEDNHNGGMIAFGPDDLLYIGMGDGGGGGDPDGEGQNRESLLGDLLRIDVDAGDPYAIPPDNPYATHATFRREIWASGLRNPWRFSFDRNGSTLYVADVGQSTNEEVNAVPADLAGVNYGWDIMEGTDCFSTTPCNTAGLTLPVTEYDNDSDGCSVTGGYVYRGTTFPALAGLYFYSDFCEGWLRSFRLVAGTATDEREWAIPSIGNVSSFGEDGAGELYILSADGTVYRIQAPEGES
jgi:glucose/arabinose dehydrogenase